jgi:hypothetical protein
VLPTETWGFWLGIDIGGGCEALLVSPERRRHPCFLLLNGNYDGKVIALSLQPCCLLCMIAAQMVIRRVFLRNAMNWLGIPLGNLAMNFL